MQLTQSTPLEQSITGLHTNNTETKEWFYGTVVTLLENDHLPYFTKADRLSSSLMNVDAKIAYIKEQTKILQQMRKQLELSRTNAKEQIAKALQTFGIDKLEGVQVSSISVTSAYQTSKTNLNILDEQALIQAGYFTVMVDKQAVEEALYSSDQRHEVEAYVETSVEVIQKPATIRINKRKSVSSGSTQIEAA